MAYPLSISHNLEELHERFNETFSVIDRDIFGNVCHEFEHLLYNCSGNNKYIFKVGYIVFNIKFLFSKRIGRFHKMKRQDNILERSCQISDYAIYLFYFKWKEFEIFKEGRDKNPK